MLVLLIGAYYRYRITSTEEKLQEMRVESQKKLEAFKENGTYKEVSTLMAQLEAKTPRRGGAAGVKVGDGKVGPGRSQAPSTEPRSKRTGSTHPVQGDAATVKVAPSTVAVKRTNKGDKGDPAPADHRQISSDPTPAQSNTKLSTSMNQGDESAKVTGQGDRAISSSTSVLPPSRVPSTSLNQPLSQSSSQPSSAQVQRLHLNPVPQSPFRPPPFAPQSPPTVSQVPPASKGWMDWFVDKLVGSEATTPKWCAFCGAHNGLVPVDELQNVRFVCHNCKSYNAPEIIQQLRSKDGAQNLDNSSSPPTSQASSSSSSQSSSTSQSSSSSSSPENSEMESPIVEETVSRRQRSASKPKHRRRLSSGGSAPKDAEFGDTLASEPDSPRESGVSEGDGQKES